MEHAESYEEWFDAALSYDEKAGHARWKRRDQSRSYDYVSIRHRLDRLRTLRARHDHHGLLYALNEGIHGNMGGMGKSALYERARVGTKQLIVDYVDEIVAALELLASDQIDDISEEEKQDFFRRARHCFGQSALMMSGSGMLLYFHLGVVKALFEQNLLPSVMSGSSGGAIVGCMLATHSDEELKKFFDPHFLAHEIEAEAGLLSVVSKLRPRVLPFEEIREWINRLIPDQTFQESLQKTGRQMNVSIAPAETHQTSRLLNATTSPNVFIREAVMASGAVPGIYPAVTLAAKNNAGERVDYLPSRKWVDGAMSDDLPAKRLARLYGVNHYIVSQTNPHVIPFVSDAQRRQNITSVLKYAGTRTAREWLNASATIMRKPLARRPRINQVTNTVLAILNQDYIGDINILPPFRFYDPRKLISHLSVKDILSLIEAGERATWPKIEMIRIQTKISRTLERIHEGQ